MSEFLSSGEENQFSSSNLHSIASLDNLKSVQSSAIKDTPNSSEDTGKTPASKDRDAVDLQTPSSDNFLRSNFQNTLNEQSPDTPEPQSEAVGETEAERRAREERESEALAWELMQQENMELYQLQMQFMQENAAAFSQDDYQALQMIISETGRPQQQQIPRRNGNRRTRVAEADSNEEDAEGADTESYVSDEEGIEFDDEEQASGEEEGEEEDDDPDNWDYERLLELGQVIGDVKTERWRKRAQAVIKSLPTVQYKDITAQYEESTAAVTTSVEKKLKRTIDDISASPVKPSTATSLAAASSNSCSKDSLASLSSSHTGDSSASKTAGVCRTGSNHKKAKKCLPSKTRALDHRCAVCMDPFEPDDTLNLLPCQHYFHIPCTEGWMADHNSCPQCKAKISATPEK